jgi:hypothetical protein
MPNFKNGRNIHHPIEAAKQRKEPSTEPFCLAVRYIEGDILA